jgi:hypothetical protein
MTSTEPKICHACKVATWLCRNCGRRTCEHYCGYKANGTAMCQPCQRLIAENWTPRKREPNP